MLKSHNYATSIMENSSLDEEEKELVLVYLTSSMTLEQRKKEELFNILFKDWFRLEIENSMNYAKEVKNPMLHYKLKLMLEKLKNENQFVKNLYIDFKNLVKEEANERVY